METKSLLKTCPCGHDKNHKLVIAHKDYSVLGKFLQLMGVSAKPHKISYQCAKCHVYFDETTDPNSLKNQL